MRLYDQHLHSWNSFDCQTPPSANAERAVAAGLAGLTFTEHFDTHPNEWDACIYDDAKIENELGELRRQFEGKLFIGKGIEVCYQPDRMDFILDFLQRHSFDIVLLSVHWAFGKPVHVREEFADMTPSAFIDFYLDAVADATDRLVELKKAGRQPFHVLGHLDFAKRYAGRFFDYAAPTKVNESVDRILTNCLKAGIVPEVNTSTLRHNLPEPMPGPAIMRRYAELGGTMMSLGSDAHSPDSIGRPFERAVQMMREAGIAHLAFFRQGKVEAIPLSEAAR